MPKRPDLPDLAATGRRYREDTIRTRLQSPGIERYVSKRPALGPATRVVLAVLLAGGLVAAMLLLGR
jgi:hypothetical protein